MARLLPPIKRVAVSFILTPRRAFTHAQRYYRRDQSCQTPHLSVYIQRRIQSAFGEELGGAELAR